MNLIEEIKSRSNIINLISYLGIKMTGSNFIKSIYKDEKTPSLKIFPETNSFYCYATSQGGDLIKFYEDYNRVDTKEAVKELAEWLGLNYSSNSNSTTIPSSNSPQLVFKTIQQNYKLLESEKEFFQERVEIIHYNGLPENESRELAYSDVLIKRKEIQSKIFEQLYLFNKEKVLESLILSYLKGEQRKLTDSTINQFKLFSINSVKENIEFLRDTFERDEIILTGLFKNKYFLFTKHRLIIPYIEAGKITYLRGRYFYKGNSKPESFGKYIGLNNWSDTLSPKRFYNIDLLTKIRPFTNLVICEGEFDSMIAVQNKLNAIGIAGVSNFPKNNIHLLNNFNIYLAFDNDEAGKKAASEIAKLFTKPIKQIVLINHKDLSEFY